MDASIQVLVPFLPRVVMWGKDRVGSTLSIGEADPFWDGNRREGPGLSIPMGSPSSRVSTVPTCRKGTAAMAFSQPKRASRRRDGKERNKARARTNVTDPDGKLWEVAMDVSDTVDVQRRRKKSQKTVQQVVHTWAARYSALALHTELAIRDMSLYEASVQERMVERRTRRRIERTSIPTRVELAAFGSTLMGVAAPSSDLDLVILAPRCFEKDKTKVLWALRRHIAKTDILKTTKVLVIPSKKVPFMRFTDQKTQIRCDVVIGTRGTVFKSRALRLLLGYDRRAKVLVKLVKQWAKNKRIDSPKSGTLNSYSLVLLVVVYLQSVYPRVLPALEEVMLDGIERDSIIFWRARCHAVGLPETAQENLLTSLRSNSQRWKARKKACKNEDSLGTLFEGFFGFCIKSMDVEGGMPAFNAFTGKAHACNRHQKAALVQITDPFDEGENCARAVRHRLPFERMKEAFLGTAADLGRIHTPGKRWEYLASISSP